MIEVVATSVVDNIGEIMYYSSVSAKLAEKYAMYEPATSGAGKKK